MRIYGALAGHPCENQYNAMSVQQLAEAGGHLPPVVGVNVREGEYVETQSGTGAASSGPSQDATLRLRILLSYHYYKDTDLDALFARYFTSPYPEVFLDSGGFSAATQGVTIDLEEYAAYIRRFAHLLAVYANLDAIGDARTTRANQRRLEALGLAPIPVFHVGEDWRYLEEYVDRYPYIALGGMVPYMKTSERPKLMPWLVRAFKVARGPDGVVRSVYHGFGATSWEVVKAFPWYSVDSSSWGQGFRFGQAPIFDDRAGRFLKVSLGDHAACYAAARQFRALGFDPGDFADRGRYSRAKMAAVSALSYMHAERWLQRRHGLVEMPRRPDVPAGAGTSGRRQPRPFGEAAGELTEMETGEGRGVGVKIHLADTSNGINYSDADKGLKAYLGDHAASPSSPSPSPESGTRVETRHE